MNKSSEEKSYHSYKRVVSNAFCNIDGGNKCYDRKKKDKILNPDIVVKLKIQKLVEKSSS